MSAATETWRPVADAHAREWRESETDIHRQKRDPFDNTVIVNKRLAIFRSPKRETQ
jgi:hypothetical protein